MQVRQVNLYLFVETPYAVLAFVHNHRLWIRWLFVKLPFDAITLCQEREGVFGLC